MAEWEQYMKDFVPEDITTVVISPRQELVSKSRHYYYVYYCKFTI